MTAFTLDDQCNADLLIYICLFPDLENEEERIKYNGSEKVFLVRF